MQTPRPGRPSGDAPVRDRSRRGGPRRVSRAERRDLAMVGEPPREPRDRSGHPWLAALVVLLGIVVVAGGGYAVLYGLAHDHVPRNTSIGGLNVGGLSAAAAQSLLDRQLDVGAGVGKGADQPIEVVADGLGVKVTPSVAGLTYDTGLSVNRAGATGSRDPRTLLRELFAQDNAQSLVVRLDAPALARVTAAIAKGYDQPPREGSVSFAGTQVQTVDPLPGRRLNAAALGSALIVAFQTRQTSVTAPVVTVQPVTTAAGVRSAAQRLAAPALSGPITLRVPGRSVLLPPYEFVPALTLTADRTGRFVLSVRTAVLRQSAAPEIAQLETAPRSAAVRTIGARAVVVPGLNGSRVPDAVLSAGVARAAVGRAGTRTAVLTRSSIPPALSTQALQSLRITTVTGSATATFADRLGFNQNIARAAATLNGRLLLPGAQLSFNGVVGERTAARGYAQGIVIAGGRYGKSVGGGVAVAATALFDAAYAAGWPVPERATPGVYSGTAPDGRDVTIDYPDIDLVIANSTPFGAYLQVSVDPATPARRGTITVQIFSSRWFEVTASISPRSAVSDPGAATGSLAAGCVPSAGVPGFSVLLRRLVTHSGLTVESDARTVTYSALPTVRCR